ncbi:hypothetical protein FGG08_002766 [Glutinoglossum americanum]|uniref:Mediator complex subunit 15 KIX domain-containing protein n=1 Tax=Glutinoglossum americanum TaxID=1670608 RepID=A0A9P8L487_9PEZI|nr:hypothetical protein FGG08_002766 [Glutinoglossum americanum]
MAITSANKRTGSESAEPVRVPCSLVSRNPRDSVSVAINFEQKAFDDATDKNQYETKLKDKLVHMQNARKQQQDQQNAQRSAQNAQALQMGMMAQHGVQGVMPGQGPFQQGFPHQLQQQMQASQLPVQQQQMQMQRNLAHQGQQASDPTPSGSVPGQAPQAQMVPPGIQLQMAQMGQQVSSQRPGVPYSVGAPTPQEVQTMRAKLPAGAQNMSDDQIKSLILRSQVNEQQRNLLARQSHHQQQQQLQQLHLQRQQLQQNQQNQQNLNQQAAQQAAIRAQQQMSMAMENQSSQNLSQQQPLQQIRQLQQHPRNIANITITPHEHIQINQEAQRMASNTPKEDLARIRANLQKMSQQQREALEKQGIDPLHYFFRNSALKNFKLRKAQFAAQQQGQGTPLMQGITGQQRPISQVMMGGQSQQAVEPFRGSMVDFIDQQQAEAVRSQEAGQLVVPASNNSRVSPQQMTGFPGPMGQLQPGQQGQAGVGRAMPMANTIPQQQQMLHTQQVQQERAREAAKAQARSQQVQVQAQASTVQTQLQPKVPQIGQRPPQGAAMPALNQPLRPPGQQQPDQRTPQQRPQHGLPQPGQQQSDLRFSQAPPQQTQQRPGPVGNPQMATPSQRNQMIPSNIPLALRQQLSQMSENEFRQTLAKLSAHNAQQQQAFQGQQPRPQVPPGSISTSQTPQIGTNMSAQSMPLQPPTAMSTFTPTPIPNFNTGPPSAPLRMPGGTPEQQALHKTSAQARVAAALSTLTPERLREMDVTDFPRNILNANNSKLASQIPDQVKSWGQLKEWVSRNPQHMPSGSLDKLRSLQGIHSAQLQTLKSRTVIQAGHGQQPPQPPQSQPPGPRQTAADMNSRGQAVSATGRTGQQMQIRGGVPVATAQQQHKGLKRANSDDVVEVSNPNPQQPQQQSMPHSQQNQPQNRPGSTRITPEQFAALTPQQRAQYEAQVRAAQQQAANNPEHNSQSQDMANRALSKPDQAAKLKEIAKEELKKTVERPVIDMSPEVKQIMVQKLRDLPDMLDRMEKSIPVFFSMTGQESVVKDLIKTRILLLQQFQDNRFHVKDAFSITLDELDAAKDRLKKYFHYVMVILHQSSKQQPRITSNQQQKPQQDFQQPAEDQTHPLNAANLQQHQQAFQAARQHSLQRNSRHQQPPAAPTTAQPPFPIGASSPQGVPQAYGPKSLFNLDALKLPNHKRRKGNQAGNDSAASTPVQPKTTPGSSGSPQVAKLATSPESKKQQSTDNAKSAQEAIPSHKCPNRECAFHVKGFHTAAELAKHKSDMHGPEPPQIKDPLGFCLESMADGLGLNKNCMRKTPNETLNNSSKGTSPPGTLKSGVAPSRTDQTPKMKQEATPAASVATPLGRIPTQTSNTGGKQSSSPASALLKTPQFGNSKIPTPSSVAVGGPGPTSKPAKEESEKPSSEHHPATFEQQPTPQPTPWAESSISPQNLLQCFEGLEKMQGFPAFLNVRSTTPAFTPSSKETTSSRSSDISENDALNINISGGPELAWNPFGIYDGSLGAEFEGMSVEGGLEKGGSDVFEMDWDRTFGENSGLEIPDDGAFGTHNGFDTSLFSLQA